MAAKSVRSSDFRLLGKGLYSLPEAARIASFATQKRLTSAAIRRWLWGYGYPVAGELKMAKPLWVPQLAPVTDSRVVSFRDLVEVMFVATFKNEGISLQTIRRIIGKAADLIEGKYPLSSLKFASYSKTIVADTIDPHERRSVFDLDSGQYLLETEFDRLRAALDYTDLYASRWWPLGKDRRVVVDPSRGFGRSIVALEGVPTAALQGAYRAEGSIEAVARWFEVSEESVRDAVEYEDRLSQAA